MWQNRESLWTSSLSHKRHAEVAWGGNVITRTRFFRPSMPLSSARSHNQGHPIALSTSTTMDISLAACWHSIRSWSADTIAFLISRGCGQVSSSIAEMKFVSKYSSRSLHSRIRQTESISSDREVRVWLLNISLFSAAETFTRKFQEAQSPGRSLSDYNECWSVRIPLWKLEKPLTEFS